MNGVILLESNEITKEIYPYKEYGKGFMRYGCCVVVTNTCFIIWKLFHGFVVSQLNYIAFVIGIGAFIIAVFCNGARREVSTGKYRYKAVVDGAIAIEEIMKHYNIISKDGEVWVLEGKELNKQ